MLGATPGWRLGDFPGKILDCKLGVKVGTPLRTEMDEPFK